MPRNIEKHNLSRKEWDTKARNKGDEVFGITCLICGRMPKKYRHALHKKDGKEHAHTNSAVLALKNPDEWVRLCYRCHIGVHFCMDNFGWNWEKVFSALRTRL